MSDGFIPDDGSETSSLSSDVTAATYGVLYGLSLGLAPYIRAIPTRREGESYSDAVARAKAFYAGQEQQSPKSYLGGQIAGGIVPAVATGGETLMGITGRNVATGAIQGAATAPEGQAIRGAEYGGALGGVGALGTAGTMQALSGAKSWIGRSAMAKAVMDPRLKAGMMEDLTTNPSVETYNNYVHLFGKTTPEVKQAVADTIMEPLPGATKSTSAQYNAYQDFLKSESPNQGIAPTLSKMYSNPKDLSSKDWSSLMFGGAPGAQGISEINKRAAETVASQPGFGQTFAGKMAETSHFGLPALLGAPAVAFTQAGLPGAAEAGLGVLGTGLAYAGAQQAYGAFKNKAMQDVAAGVPQWTGAVAGATVNQAQGQVQVGDRLRAVIDQTDLSGSNQGQVPFNPTYQYAQPAQVAPVAPSGDGFIPD